MAITDDYFNELDQQSLLEREEKRLLSLEKTKNLKVRRQLFHYE